MLSPSVVGPEIIARADALARFSEDPDGLTWTFLSEAHRAAAHRILEWMREAGMHARVDPLGNVVGRYEGEQPDGPALLTGSHFDTVRNAGKYDGILGLLVSIACVQALHAAGERLPFALEVVAFCDEEGARFQAALLGSRAMAGTFDARVLERRDAAGLAMVDALRASGLDPSRIPEARRQPEEVLGYVEVHIEQGPVLLSERLPVGIVTAIVGTTRLAVTVTGEAGHAGTVPMRLRRDAAAAAAEMVLCLERRCQAAPSLVGTVGELHVPRGAANMIPGRAEFSIDIRSDDDGVRGATVTGLLEELEAVARRRGVRVEIARTHEAPSVPYAGWLMRQLEETVSRAGVLPRYLSSGAGHDAMAMADHRRRHAPRAGRQRRDQSPPAGDGLGRGRRACGTDPARYDPPLSAATR